MIRIIIVVAIIAAFFLLCFMGVRIIFMSIDKTMDQHFSFLDVEIDQDEIMYELIYKKTIDRKLLSI